MRGTWPEAEKWMGPDEVLGSREVLGVVAIDGALWREARHGPEEFKPGKPEVPAETRCLKVTPQM